MPKERHKNIVAAYLILKKGNQVLLLKRQNTGYEDGNYSVIAGHVEPKENFTQCIIREAKEEAGITLIPEHLKVAHVMHRNTIINNYNEIVDTFFITEKWEGEIENKEPHVCAELKWFDINNLPENTAPSIKQAIEAIKNNNFYSEHGW